MNVRSAMARRCVLPLVAAASRDGFWGLVHRRLTEVNQSQWYPEDRIHSYQLARLRSLARHAADTVPFYRERFRSIGFQPEDLTSYDVFARISPLTRQDLREHYQQLLAEGWQERVESDSTGGSSGQPVRFAVDRDERASRAATAIRHNRWAGWDVGDRAGVVWGAPRDMVPARSLRDRITSAWLTPSCLLNAFEISDGHVRRFLEQLRDSRAEVLFGYAGSLAEFARAAQSLGQTVPTLRTVVSSAEALTPERKRVIEEWSGCSVFDRYGSRETGLIASECEQRDGLHLAWEDHFVEIETANESGVGRVLVTKLNSYGMPFLRYDIGDLASWRDGPCACSRHSRRLVIAGCRDTDFLMSADGRKVSGSALTLVVRDLPELGTVQLHQARSREVEIRVAGRASLPAQLEAELRRRMDFYLGPVSTTFRFVDQIARAPSGKFRFTVCDVPEQSRLGPAR